MKKDLISSSSELMENTIPTEKVIEQLNKIIVGIEKAKSKDEMQLKINEFYEATKSWEIVAAKPNEDLVWMQAPMEYYETTNELSFMERMKSLFKEGILYEKEMKERHAEIYSNTKIPLPVPLEPMHLFIANKNKEYKVYYSAIRLAKNIVGMINRTDEKMLAVYEKPFGVVAMNNVTHYIKDLENKTNVKTSSLRESLLTTSFYELIEKSELQMIMDEAVVKKALVNVNKKLPKKEQLYTEWNLKN